MAGGIAIYTLGALTFTNFNANVGPGYQNGGLGTVHLGRVGPTLQPPHLAGTDFSFAFETVVSQTVTIQHKDDLAVTNWVTDTNFVSGGGLQEVTLPMAAVPQRLYRVILAP